MLSFCSEFPVDGASDATLKASGPHSQLAHSTAVHAAVVALQDAPPAQVPDIARSDLTPALALSEKAPADERLQHPQQPAVTGIPAPNSAIATSSIIKTAAIAQNPDR